MKRGSSSTISTTESSSRSVAVVGDGFGSSEKPDGISIGRGSGFIGVQPVSASAWAGLKFSSR